MVQPLVAVMTRARSIAGLCIVLVVIAGALTAPVDAKKAGVHEPPYKKGPSGGDDMNFMNVDRQTGEIDIIRVFPFPSPIVGCEPESHAGYASFIVEHKLTERVRKVIVDYDQTTMDAYSFLTLKVEDARGGWLGSQTIKGPTAMASGHFAASLGSRSPAPGETITATFGVQLSSACPQVGGAGAVFSSVRFK